MWIFPLVFSGGVNNQAGIKLYGYRVLFKNSRSSRGGSKVENRKKPEKSAVFGFFLSVRLCFEIVDRLKIKIYSTTMLKTLLGKLKDCYISCLKQGDVIFLLKTLLKELKSVEVESVEKRLIVPDIFDDILNNLLLVAVLLNHVFNFLQCINDGCMVAAVKFLADFGKGHLGDFPHNVHGNLTRC